MGQLGGGDARRRRRRVPVKEALRQPAAATTRLAEPEDLDAVISAFRKSKPHSVWARMGPNLARVYFRHYLSSPHEVMVVSTPGEGGVEGACLGTSRPESYVRDFYRENAYALARALMSDIFSRPAAIFVLAGRLLRGGIRWLGPGRLAPPSPVEHLYPELPVDPGNCCYLALFFVSPEARGRRLGTLMAEHFAREMEHHGFEWCRVHTSTDNVASQTALQRAGFRRVSRQGTGLICLRRLRAPDAATGAIPITVEILSDPPAVRALSQEWDRLWRRTPEVSAFQALEWILACASHADPPGAAWYVMTFRARAELVALFPTRLSARGTLSFLGGEAGNYCGPVYAPEHAGAIVKAWRDVLSNNARIKSVDLRGLRERSPLFRAMLRSGLRGRGKLLAIETNRCPEVDLRGGWDVVLGRHKSRQVANWRRKLRSLEELDRVEFDETSDPDQIVALLPRLFELYDARWMATRVSGAFSAGLRALQLKCAKQLGARRLVLLSTLRLRGEVIAFSYSMRGTDHSSSYTLAHDARFNAFSPGSLLLIKLLESAVARGDSHYDFSLGEEPYKAIWSTGVQRVFSLAAGRGGWLRVLRHRLWTAGRSIPVLRTLKQRGVAGLLDRKEHLGLGKAADAPGIPAGPEGAWYVYRAGSSGTPRPDLRLRRLEYSEMRALFSPRLLQLALERHYRGDQAMAVEREGRVLGAIWIAGSRRRPVVTGGRLDPSSQGSVYYHPVAVSPEGPHPVCLAVARELETLVVSPYRVACCGWRETHRFRGDARFRPPRGSFRR